MGLLPRGGGGNGGSGNGGGCCGGDVNIGIVMGADGKPSALSSPDLEAVKKALAKKADLVNGKVPLEQLPRGAGPSVEVIDALDSDRADAALSAAQGKGLGIRLKELGERTFVKLHRGKDESLIIPGDNSNYWMVQVFVTFDRQPSTVPNAIPAYSCVFGRGDIGPAMTAGTGFLIKGGQILSMQALLAMKLIDPASFNNAAAYFIFVGHLVP